MNPTNIQWTWNARLEPKSGFTWNPLVGCRRISKGCGVPNGGSCYAERLIATRLSQHKVYKGLAVMKGGGPQFTGKHRLIVDRLDEPLRKRNPKGGRTFVCDLGDMFFEGHTFEEIAAVWGVMAAAQHHTFQVLTKRTKRMAEWFAWISEQGRELAAEIGERPPAATSAEGSACLMLMGEHVNIGDRRAIDAYNHAPWPLPNVWIGTSTEDQPAADDRIPWLLRCPAPVRFLSVEPQCGPVDLARWLAIPRPIEDDPLATHLLAEGIRAGTADGPRALNWIIQGGESGPGARPFDLGWAYSLRDQCESAGVAYFLKQLGARPVLGDLPVEIDDSHGGDENEWPLALRGRRAFPSSTPPKSAQRSLPVVSA